MEQTKQEGTSVPKIRHIALRATDVEAIAVLEQAREALATDAHPA